MNLISPTAFLLKKQQDDLFRSWKESNPIYKNNFAEDGIINFDSWKESKIKVLFVLKDTNGFNGNLCNRILEKFQDSKKPKTWFTSALWNIATIYTTAKGFLCLTEANDKAVETFRNVSVMNLKKLPGQTSVEMHEIEKHAYNDAEFIKMQLELINPDVIICGKTFDILRKTQKISAINIDNNENWLYLDNDERLYIAHWHPAAQYSDHLTYNALCAVLFLAHQKNKLSNSRLHYKQIEFCRSTGEKI